MRDLILRVTLITAAGACVVAGILTAASRAPWTLVLLRSAVAFVVVLAIGFGCSLILMRTALRRHYEQARAVEASRRLRGNR